MTILQTRATDEMMEAESSLKNMLSTLNNRAKNKVIGPEIIEGIPLDYLSVALWLFNFLWLHTVASHTVDV